MSGDDVESFRCIVNKDEQGSGRGESNEEYETELGNGEKPCRFSTSRVNQLLLQLEGKLLSYKMFARDTKASRST